MQMNEQVLTALEVLRNFAENDFERHRIDVLEKDLTNPPVAEVIDDTHQKFNGNIYYKHKNGHYVTNKGVHRDIWIYYYGDIPEPQGNYDIHHRDANPSNNDISNLQLLTKSEHKHIHNINHAPKEFICEVCGKKFISTRLDYGNRFCSTKCRNAYTTKNYRENKICLYCKKEFSAPKNSNVQYCSKTCVNRARWDKWKEKHSKEKICPICGSKFISNRSSRKYCSRSCSLKAIQESQKKYEDKKRQEKKKNCPVCGKEFIPSHPKGVYCSISCSQKKYWENRQKTRIQN